MKNNILKYLIEIFKILIWPIIFLIGQFIVNYIFSLGYSIAHPNLSLSELIQNTTVFLDNNKVIITFISFIILMLIFIPHYKKLNKDNYKTYPDFIYLILFGIGYSIVINILFFNISTTFNFSSNQFNVLDKSQFMPLILCSGLMGPILEEYLFRGIIYNKLKKFNSVSISTFLTAVIFSLLHANVFNIINAFILNYILIFVYNKYRTLLAPIILHISINTTVVLIINIIISNFNNLNYLIFIMGLIFIIISSVKIFNKE